MAYRGETVGTVYGVGVLGTSSMRSGFGAFLGAGDVGKVYTLAGCRVSLIGGKAALGGEVIS